jgi:RNA polymerase sigma-70 factor (ECF subfamily)
VTASGFDELVRRHRPMAIAYASALLGDRALADEATQQALITAWERLSQLRARGAFAAWLRRIVRSECHRIRRRARAAFVPLADASARPDDAPDAGERLDDERRRAAAVRALHGLSERQRQVAVLHYEHHHSVDEIAAFLGMRPSAVAQRLHAARARLRDTLVDSLECPPRSPPRDDLRLRPCPVDGRVRRSYVVEAGPTRRIVARGAIAATPFRPMYELKLVAGAEALRTGAPEALLDRLLADLQALDAISVWLRAPAQATDLLAFLGRRGFRETARVLELRLPLRTAPRRRAPGGFAIASLDDERRRDPAFVARLRGLLDELRAEDPTRPFVPVPLATVERWLRNRNLSPDTGFVACRGDDYVGLADLRMGEDLPAFTFIGVTPRARGRGVATALVRAALAAAHARGARVASALVGMEHESALALFDSLGFRPAGARVTVERYLRQVVDPDPRVYDSYSGRYAFPADDLRCWSPGLTMTIARRGDRLVSQARDVIDHWLPGRDGAFFVKEHYGTIRFVRDARGRVTHLVYRDGAREVSASRID